MAATGKTPILLYGSTTATNAPVAGNLTNSSDGCEIAINVADKNLFFKDATNTVNTVPIRQSSASSNGWLSSTDWSTFNGKVSSQWVTSGSDIYYNTGNVGVGATPSAWSYGGNIQLVAGGSVVASNSYARFGANFYYNAGWIYQTSAPASMVECAAGDIRFNVAASGTAGNPITWITSLTGDSTGNVTVNAGNLVIGTSGKGIDFSATAGTGTSELLADYEEGTWTPTQGGGLTVVGAFSSTGTYTKIGRQVTVRGTVSGATSVACTSAGAICAGLPYTVANDTQGSFCNSALSQGGSIDCHSTTIYAVGAITATPTILFTISYFV